MTKAFMHRLIVHPSISLISLYQSRKKLELVKDLIKNLRSINMPIGTRIHYPPCDSVPCTGDGCAGSLPGDAKKFVWPELIGVKAEVAKAQIERDNPYVTAVIAGVMLFDTCRNRVYVHVDDNGIVIAPAPQVG